MGLIAKGLEDNHTLIQILVHGNQGCVSGQRLRNWDFGSNFIDYMHVNILSDDKTWRITCTRAADHIAYICRDGDAKSPSLILGFANRHQPSSPHDVDRRTWMLWGFWCKKALQKKWSTFDSVMTYSSPKHLWVHPLTQRTNI